MSHKAKPASGQPTLTVDGEVVRKIRQHARTSMKSEICGVLVGQDRPGRIEIQASIPGVNAEEAGTHVTFTQDTWEHIYQVKDKQYPDHRIVGWYHSHPGFGVFLSDHDTFIHKNFFASPGQVAWVFDPHSDEEGCFGWVGTRIERLSQISIVDRRGGEGVQESGRPEPAVSTTAMSTVEEPEARRRIAQSSFGLVVREEESSESSLVRLATNVFSYLTVLLLGILIAWYIFPRVEVMPVPVDPRTGQPLVDDATQPSPENSGETEPAKKANPNSNNQSSGNNGTKPRGNDGQPR
jgi:proteasome lid subunit RPN8/RPN11